MKLLIIAVNCLVYEGIFCENWFILECDLVCADFAIGLRGGIRRITQTTRKERSSCIKNCSKHTPCCLTVSIIRRHRQHACADHAAHYYSCLDIPWSVCIRGPSCVGHDRRPCKTDEPSTTILMLTSNSGSVAEWLARWTQAQKGPGSDRSRDAIG